MSTSRLSTSEDLEVSDTSDPLLCDSDVAGSGATLNDNAVNIDVDISSDCDVGGRHVSSCSLTQSMSSEFICYCFKQPPLNGRICQKNLCL